MPISLILVIKILLVLSLFIHNTFIVRIICVCFELLLEMIARVTLADGIGLALLHSLVYPSLGKEWG